MSPIHKPSFRGLGSGWTAPLVLLLILCLHIPESQSYGTGAPPGRTVCTTMTPGHQGIEAQSGDSPYKIELDNADIPPGTTILVTLKSRSGNTPFAGFLVMGQKYRTNPNLLVGAPEGNMTHKPGTNPDSLHHVNCGDQARGAMTHSNNQPKMEIELQWTAPHEEGEYLILGTFVQSYNTFWVRQPSIKIRVGRNTGVAIPGPPTKTPEYAEEALEALQHEYYDGCGKTKGCFGLPESCVESQSCDMLTTFRVHGSQYAFQVTGKLPKEGSTQGHVSSGLSFDDKMGSDSVIGCVWKDDYVVSKSYYNFKGEKQNSIMVNQTAGLVNVEMGLYVNGHVFCQFTRSERLVDANNEIGRDIDLRDDKFHIMLARSSVIPASGPNGEKLGYHFDGVKDKGVSAVAVPMTYIGILGAESKADSSGPGQSGTDSSGSGQGGAAAVSSSVALFVFVASALL